MDDEPALRTTTSALLRQLGYTVEEAATGEAAVAAYQAAQDRGTPFAGVILDLTVRGGMGGVETLQTLRNLDPTVRALVSSGSADSPALLDPAGYGFQGALAKPCRLAALSEAIAKLLRP